MERLGQLNLSSSGTNSSQNTTSPGPLSGEKSADRPSTSPPDFGSTSDPLKNVQQIQPEPVDLLPGEVEAVSRSDEVRQKSISSPMDISEEASKVTKMEVDEEGENQRQSSRKRNLELPKIETNHPAASQIANNESPATPSANAVMPALELVTIVESIFKVRFFDEPQPGKIPPSLVASSELLTTWLKSESQVDFENLIGSICFELVGLHVNENLRDPKFLQPETFPDDDLKEVSNEVDIPSMITYWFLDVYDRTHDQERAFPKVNNYYS